MFEVSAPDGANTGRLAIPKLHAGVASAHLIHCAGRGADAAAAAESSRDSAADWIYSNTSGRSIGAVASDAARHIGVEEDSSWLYITGLRPGTHRFQVKYHTDTGKSHTRARAHTAPRARHTHTHTHTFCHYLCFCLSLSLSPPSPSVCQVKYATRPRASGTPTTLLSTTRQHCMASTRPPTAAGSESISSNLNESLHCASHPGVI